MRRSTPIPEVGELGNGIAIPFILATRRGFIANKGKEHANKREKTSIIKNKKRIRV